MLLELIWNLPEKFRNITFKIQELTSKKPETFLKNSENEKSERPLVGFDPAISRSQVERANHYTELDLFWARQKDNIIVDSGLRDCGECFSKIYLEHI